MLRRPQNFAQSSPYFWLALHRTKVRWRFRKILWPSQNIWTLLTVQIVALCIPSQWFSIKYLIKHYSYKELRMSNWLGLGYEFGLQRIVDSAIVRLYSVCAHKSNNLSSYVHHNFDRPSYFMYLKSWQAVVKFCKITFNSLVSIAIKEGTLCSKKSYVEFMFFYHVFLDFPPIFILSMNFS